VSFGFEARFFRELMSEVGVSPRRMLVIGCGDGTEPAHLAEAMGAIVVGVDLEVDPRWKRPGVHLLRADARRLPFRDGVFEAVYSYHVLEHVPGPEGAVTEARRTLMPSGAGYFGTPNRSRLVGYIGGRATTWQKLWWNLIDWGRRLQGRWTNEQGAHAGFTREELARLVGRGFGEVESVDLPYYLGKYPRLSGFWRFAFRTGIARFVAPSVYVRSRAGIAGR